MLVKCGPRPPASCPLSVHRPAGPRPDPGRYSAGTTVPAVAVTRSAVQINRPLRRSVRRSLRPSDAARQVLLEFSSRFSGRPLASRRLAPMRSGRRAAFSRPLPWLALTGVAIPSLIRFAIVGTRPWRGRPSAVGCAVATARRRRIRLRLGVSVHRLELRPRGEVSQQQPGRGLRPDSTSWLGRSDAESLQHQRRSGDRTSVRRVVDQRSHDTARRIAHSWKPCRGVG